MKISLGLLFLFAACNGLLFAQNADKDSYQLEVMKLNILKSYQDLPVQALAFMDSARVYAVREDYELAFVFIEMAREEVKKDDANENLQKSLNQEKQNKNPQITVYDDVSQPNPLDFSFLTGVDFNRQEFELGFDQSDSLLLDEIQKPFIGFELNWIPGTTVFSLYNAFRYDRENLKNDFALKNQFAVKSWNFQNKTGFSLDKNYTYPELGFNEWYAEINIDNHPINGWYFDLKDNLRQKGYEEPSVSIPDYLRNYLVITSGYNFESFKSLQLSYISDYNNSYKTRNNDFWEHNAELTVNHDFNQVLFSKISSQYRYFDFCYALDDTLLFSNIARSININPDITYRLNQKFSVNLDVQWEKKDYSAKTEQDPDYSYQLYKPGLSFNLGTFTTISMDYVHESKKHKVQQGLNEQYILDQDYYANGLETGIDYSFINGFLVSGSLEYTMRRYPNAETEADFSIYSNRNIISVLIFVQTPIAQHVDVSLVGAYDNDKDKDHDYNDTVSSFFTLELRYTF